MYNRFIDALSQYGLVYIQNIFVLWTVKKNGNLRIFFACMMRIKTQFHRVSNTYTGDITDLFHHQASSQTDRWQTIYTTLLCGKYLIPGFKIFLHWLYSEKKIIINYISTLYSFGLFIHDTSSLLTNNNITSSSNQILNIGGQYKSLCPNVKTSIPWNYKIILYVEELFSYL